MALKQSFQRKKRTLKNPKRNNTFTGVTGTRGVETTRAGCIRRNATTVEIYQKYE